MKLIVGLGNVGKEYENTRHNIGFMALDKLADKLDIVLKHEPKFKGLINIVNINGNKTILLEPATFMNNSGEAISLVMKFYKIDVSDILIICDDLDMEVGKIRFRESGSAGGHNGLKSIIAHTGTDKFKRIKVGISKDKNIPIVDYVLGHFKDNEKELIDNSLDIVSNALYDFLSHNDFQKMAMSLK